MIFAVIAALFFIGLPLGFGTFGPVPDGGAYETETKKPAQGLPGYVQESRMQAVKLHCKQVFHAADTALLENGTNITVQDIRDLSEIDEEYHFIVTINKKDNTVKAVSYFTDDYSVRYESGKYSTLANAADDSFEDAVLFL